MNQTIYQNIDKLGDSKYMTLTMLLFEQDGRIHYSGLHQDLLVYRKSGRRVEAIETNGMWLGITDDISGMNSVEEIRLEPGDKMLLFTDGIVEALDSDEQMYGDDKLKSVFEESGELSTNEIRDRVLKSLEGYTTSDDVTMLVVKRNEPSQG